MLLYNSKKEFIGIDEATLRKVGYNTLKELEEDVRDFADLFDKKPGVIHNFKNFSWIDFLIHSDKKDVRAHIRCNGKLFSAGFKVENFFLNVQEGGSEKAYLVKITQLDLIGDDTGSAPRELFEPELPAPVAMPDLQPVSEQRPYKAAQIDEAAAEDKALIADAQLPSASLPAIDQEPVFASRSDDVREERLSIDIDLDELQSEETPSAPQPLKAQSPTPAAAAADAAARLQLHTPGDYIYDPSLAANELGLPHDLIDEFVGDFIIQAKKFRPEIEEAAAKKDFGTIQILSHKLKGVAANLRIENALEVLTKINDSHDPQELKLLIDYLFGIIHKLEFHAEAPETDLIEDASDESSLRSDSRPSFPPLDSEDAEDERLEETFEDSLGEDMYSFELLQNDSKEKEYQALSALADELSVEEEDLPSLIDHDSALQTVAETPSKPLPIVQIPDAAPESAIHEETAEYEEEPQQEDEDFDIYTAAEKLGMTAEDLRTYVQEFVDQANSLKTELENALKSRNFNQVRTIATELKGAAEALHMSYASALLTHMQKSDDIRFTIENAKAFFVFVRQL